MIVQRAIAKTLVSDTADVIRLLNKYGVKVSKDVSYKELYILFKGQVTKSSEFANEFSALMVKRKRLIDYNNHRNAIGAIIGAVVAVGSTVASLITAKKQREAAKEMASEQLNTEVDLTIMQMMMQEDANKVAMAKQETILVISAVAAMVIVTGIIIFTRNKK